jgi:hypothetical protein
VGTLSNPVFGAATRSCAQTCLLRRMPIAFIGDAKRIQLLKELLKAMFLFQQYVSADLWHSDLEVGPFTQLAGRANSAWKSLLVDPVKLGGIEFTESPKHFSPVSREQFLSGHLPQVVLNWKAIPQENVCIAPFEVIKNTTI